MHICMCMCLVERMQWVCNKEILKNLTRFCPCKICFQKNGCLLTLFCVWVILLLRIVIIFTTCQGWPSMGLYDCFGETFIAVYFSKKKKHIWMHFEDYLKGKKIPIFMWIFINWVALNKMNIEANCITQFDYSWNTKHCKLFSMNIVIDAAFIVLSFHIKAQLNSMILYVVSNAPHRKAV